MNLGFTEMAFIFVLALIIFGPKKLPDRQSACRIQACQQRIQMAA